MIKLCAYIFLLLFTYPAAASDPVPIRIVVPYTPGGPTGNLANLVQRTLSQELKTPVIVEYRPGAGGAIGTAQALANSSDPILILNNSAIILNTFKNPQPYSERQLLPVVYLGRMPLILASSKKSGITAFHDIARVPHSRTLTFGSAGVGSVNHLTMERLSLALKQDFVHVPYRGSSGIMTDILAGHIDLAWLFWSPNVVSQMRQQDIIALAVDDRTRLSDLPNVPTLQELGIVFSGNFSWYAVFQAGRWHPDQLRQVQRIMQETLLDPLRSIIYKDFGLVWEAKDIIPGSGFIEQQRNLLTAVVKRVTFNE
jgi:tripartite-type tricarboxylate transporter receptor subunit TctC